MSQKALVSPVELNNEPIDFVYLYVNGSDPTQSMLVDSISRDEARSKIKGRASLNSARFRDWGELRYSIRSVVRNAPWFRRMYLVLRNNSTQLPSWLSSHAVGDRLRVVTHDEIFPKGGNYLPTASSRAIEANVHRIDGLSKRFVLMNDDFFVFSPLEKRLLFPSSTSHFICLNSASAPDEKVIVRNPTARELSVKRASSLLNSAYGYHKRRDDCHAPQVIDVELMSQLQSLFPEEFKAVISNRARTGDTITVRYMYNQWLLDTHREFQVVSRTWAIRNALSFGITSSMLRNKIYFLLASILRPQFLATNDNVDDNTPNIDGIHSAFKCFCEKNFPWRSQFEIENEEEK